MHALFRKERVNLGPMDDTEHTYSLPDLCGPKELADLLVWLRTHAAQGMLSPISQSGIRNLINLAFYLSLSPEEGRYPRFRLVNQKETDFYLAIKFDNPIELKEIGELRRLAPACTAVDFALLITEQDDSLWCVGLNNIGAMGLNSMPGRPEDIAGGRPPSLRVWIEGPGHLFVQDHMETLELKAGKVRRTVPFWLVPAIRTFSAHLGEKLFERVIDIERDDKNSPNYFGGKHAFRSVILGVMERLLLACFKLGHGGTFVILPNSDGLTTDFDITCTYNASNLDLGQDVVNFWVQCIRASRATEKSKFERELVQWNQAKARLVISTELASGLSAIDGCVVINDCLRVQGFGGFIGISDDAVRESVQTYKLEKDRDTVSYTDFMNAVGGARHQSAARLCAKHLEVITIVVSQDRQLHVFCIDPDRHVRRYGPLDPYYLEIRSFS